MKWNNATRSAPQYLTFTNLNPGDYFLWNAKTELFRKLSQDQWYNVSTNHLSGVGIGLAAATVRVWRMKQVQVATFEEE